MPKSLNPGPPLTPEPEFCESDPPDGLAYAKAIGVAFLMLIGGGVAWFSVAVITQRLWAVTTVVLGIVAGWAINRTTAGRRSLSLGVMAGAATVLAAAVGYIMLWLPLTGTAKIDKSLSWYDLVMGGLGAFVAYRFAGPKPTPNRLD